MEFLLVCFFFNDTECETVLSFGILQGKCGFACQDEWKRVCYRGLFGDALGGNFSFIAHNIVFLYPGAAGLAFQQAPPIRLDGAVWVNVLDIGEGGVLHVVGPIEGFWVSIAKI